MVISSSAQKSCDTTRHSSLIEPEVHISHLSPYYPQNKNKVYICVLHCEVEIFFLGMYMKVLMMIRHRECTNLPFKVF